MTNAEFETANTNQYCAIHGDIFSSPIVLHPNRVGEPAPSVTFRQIPCPANFWFLWFDYKFGSSAWAGKLTILIEITQSGEPTLDRRFLLSASDKDMPYVNVFSNGKPIDLQLRLELQSDSDYDFSAVTIGPIKFSAPVFRYMPTSTSSDSGRILLSGNSGGLMNRLQPLISILHMAKAADRAAYVLWPSSMHSRAEFEDIFDVEASGFESVKSLSFCNPVIWANYTTPSDNTIPLQSFEGRDVIVFSTVKLQSDQVPAPSDKDISDIFGSLVLSRYIREKIEFFAGDDFANTIGFHIRRPFPGNAFAAIETSKFTIPVAWFVAFMHRILRDNPWVEKILLCTNSIAAEGQVVSELGNKVITLPKNSVDNTTDAVAVQEGVADLVLLSKCRAIFSQSKSDFGLFAHYIGGRPLYRIREVNSGDTLLQVGARGRPMRDVSLSDSEPFVLDLG